MSKVNMVLASDLAEGDTVDLTYAILLAKQREYITDEPGGDTVSVSAGLVTVDSVTVEQPADMGIALENYRDFGDYDIAVVYSTDGGNWAIPAGMLIPRIES